MKRDQPSKMELTFKLAADAASSTAEVKAQLGGTWFPWSLGKDAKVCDNLLNGKKCPLKQGDEVTYALGITIPKIAPVGAKVLVQIRLTDDKKKGVVCTRFPVLVTA